MTVIDIVKLISELLILLSTVAALFANLHRISKGTKCQLRSEMLRIYYANKTTKQIRQYELENFVLLYEAYKALRQFFHRPYI